MAIQREKVEQAHIVQLLKTLRGKVYVIGTRRSRGKPCPKCGFFVQEWQGTRQTAGIPDLLAFLPDLLHGAGERVALFVEAKAGRGRMTDEQAEFRALCQMAGIQHVVGDLDAVIAWAIEHGYLKRESVPHYRQPQGSVV